MWRARTIANARAFVIGGAKPAPPDLPSCPGLTGASSTPRLLDSITASGILGRPVPSAPRLRRGTRSLWPAEALAKAASRAMTVVCAAQELQRAPADYDTAPSKDIAS